MHGSVSIDVVVPAFNAGAFLERAIDSVEATRHSGVHVYIVDDGSTDATRELAHAIAARASLPCTVLSHPGNANLGVSASRNLGLASGSAEWVAFLDADDYYLPHRFEALEKILAQRDDIDGVYETSEVRLDDPMASGAAATFLRDHARFGITRPLESECLLNELLRGSSWTTSAITLRRSLLHTTGVFDAKKRIAEDCDLWFRAVAAGNIVPGDLDRPVSVYWRHSGNTYEYDLRHRLAMLRAMFDSRHWVLAHAADRAAVMTTGVRNYLLRSMIALREGGRPDLAWQAWRLFLGADAAGALAHPGVLRQAASSARERFFARPRPVARSEHDS